VLYTERGRHMLMHNRQSRRRWGQEALTVASRSEIGKRADKAAQEVLGVSSRREAFSLLDAGKLSGTAAEAEFSSLRFLLER
jgi:hypothetical protein